MRAACVVTAATSWRTRSGVPMWAATAVTNVRCARSAVPIGVNGFRTLFDASATGTPAANVPLVAASHQIEIGQGQADDADPGGGEHADQRSLLFGGQRGQLSQVSDRDASLPARPHGLPRDLAHVQVLG